ncbi:hypothetical protein BI040_gp26 [Escherichia phage vB_EcoS_NBD2]|uniref:Uncharacterized protein n=1 Tax=Escherichia phage vB_EcoS_NBD2 TaxID=1852563 RepID=A0A192Y8J9_9CAUD|nr:hypothetical protein BI040_gp26 [Escherichia phage vB_EcoS_NBD2]ANM45928.1 hypothetical protein NBD2_86 [Escherichia phage vB_EcoS_NBD2]
MGYYHFIETKQTEAHKMRKEITGTRHASEDGQFIQTANGSWFSLQTDFNWRPYKMTPRVEQRLKVVEFGAKASIWRRG